MFRRVFLLACTGGGVYGAMLLLKNMATKIGTGGEFSFTGEGALLAIPVCMVGALLGALLGSLIFPARS